MENAFVWLQDLWAFILWLMPTYHHHHCFEACVTVTWGRRVRVRRPGIFIYWPPVTDVYFREANQQVIVTAPVALTTKDSETYTTRAVVRYTIDDPVKALVDTDSVDLTMRGEVAGHLAEYVADTPLETLLSDDRKATNLGLTRLLRRRLRRFGVKVSRAMLTDLALNLSLHHFRNDPDSTLQLEEEE